MLLPTITGVPYIDLCTPSSSYCIDIEVSNHGIVNYMIDIDGNNGFDHPRDVELIAATVKADPTVFLGMV